MQQDIRLTVGALASRMRVLDPEDFCVFDEAASPWQRAELGSGAIVVSSQTSIAYRGPDGSCVLFTLN